MNKVIKRVVIVILTLLALSTGHHSQAQGKDFAIRKGAFYYAGHPIKIYSGEMHYARIPKEYWRHRLKMLKAMGLNTVATYVFWNYHNTAPGVWDFKTGNKDLAGFIRTAQEEGLFVILRPGPYACAEWEFGGYPWWLQQNPDLQIRTYNQPFLDSCKVYLEKLADQVKDLQVSKGGPIIMVQVENEFGSYVAQTPDIPADEHAKYKQAIYAILKESGFEGPFFTSDGSWLFEGGAIEGVLPTANGEGNIENLKKAVEKYHNGQGPYMVAEFYPGWLDHWAEEFIRVPTDQIQQQTEKYLANGVNFNLYMAHGGTNFGFTSGANYNEEHDIQPDITSYDYDAPISEAGWTTEKYRAIRKAMKRAVPYTVPEIPEAIPTIAIPTIRLSKAVDLFEWKKDIKPEISDSPLSFEELGQGHGYVLYSKTFTQPVSGTLKIEGLRDYALVYVNGKKSGVLNRYYKNYEMPISIPFNGRLDILVENMGRINYGQEIIHNRKGIISPVYIGDFEITGGWKMYRMPMAEAPSFSGTIDQQILHHPTLYSGEFDLKVIGDTFLDMSKWGKGIVFVNGHHLGRYWQKGPQQTLYLPGCWLNEGKNEITIFEMIADDKKSAVSAVELPELDALYAGQKSDKDH